AVGEFRHVVTVFINVKIAESGEQINTFMQPVFRLSRQYGGCLARLDFGDKGCNMLIFWGAPLKLENDIERALDFLLDLRSAVSIPFRAGVTHRLMYAGYAGGSQQGEFTCYGRGINLAARQMMKAEWNQVWLDIATTRIACDLFTIKPIGELPFKGFSVKQPVAMLMDRVATTRLHVYR
ncbi:MAG: hypothetical protein GY869_02245, partial [Planctomycetes bacterium]|nr:hypothetical protein [Planctomycetota bacterium]